MIIINLYFWNKNIEFINTYSIELKLLKVYILLNGTTCYKNDVKKRLRYITCVRSIMFDKFFIYKNQAIIVVAIISVYTKELK